MTNSQAIDKAADKSAANWTRAYFELNTFMDSNRSEWNLTPRKMRKRLALQLASRFWDNASEDSLQAFDSWAEVVRIMENVKEW